MTIVKQIYGQSLGIFVICFLLNDITLAKEDLREPYTVVASNVNEPGAKTLFNPRVDYNNQWMPVGYTDPLKDEPTLDYSPPTLERVRYWSEFNDGNNNKNVKPSVNTNTNNNHLNEKNEMLMLGQPIKLYAHNKHSTNQLTHTEAKSSHRRSSTYYPAEPSRVLTPPPMQQNLILFDQMPYAADHHIASNYYWNNDIPPSYSDAHSEESASYLTILKPKTSQSPHSTTTLYNKDAHNSMYNLAANVNSLEMPEQKSPWIQSLLQTEVTHQTHSTTPQMVVAYTPHAFDVMPVKFNRFSDSSNSIRSTTDMSFMFTPSTTPAPKTTLSTTSTTTTTTTTRSPLSFFKPAILPTRPPMHLIIQGHSKVTKYGAESSNSSKHYHEPKVVPITMNRDPVVKHIVLHETNGNEMHVKHLHKMQTPVLKIKSTTATSSLKKASNSPMESLLNLLDKSFADFSLHGHNESLSSENGMKKSNFTESKKSTVESTISTITGPTTIRSIDELETRGTTRLS